MSIGSVGAPEWVKRLQSIEPAPIHRSIDCIAKELSNHGVATVDPLKNAPSWVSVAVHHPLPAKAPEPVRKAPVTPGTSSSTSSTSHKVNAMPESTSALAKTTPTTDEEAKAAELAAKKTRIKQSLVKRARSVAIFSLKLKERRQREAEKAAQAAIEHAKVSLSLGVVEFFLKLFSRLGSNNRL